MFKDLIFIIFTIFICGCTKKEKVSISKEINTNMIPVIMNDQPFTNFIPLEK